MTESKTIRVIIVDDHAVVRSGLSTFLLIYPDLEMVGEAENGEEAVRLCDRLVPDVVLMDLMMPVMDGVAAIRAIRNKHSQIQIIALTSFSEEGLVQGALQAGAVGYLMKNVTGVELANAIRSAHAGRLVLSQEATQVLIQSSTQTVVPGEDLTAREREVLSLMVDGLNNAQIAKKLVVSQSTVKYHIGNIFSKLGVENRVEAVRLAIERRLLH
jgi:NarL family two-component system response regulator LiaR